MRIIGSTRYIPLGISLQTSIFATVHCRGQQWFVLQLAPLLYPSVATKARWVGNVDYRRDFGGEALLLGMQLVSPSRPLRFGAVSAASELSTSDNSFTSHGRLVIMQRYEYS